MIIVLHYQSDGTRFLLNTDHVIQIDPARHRSGSYVTTTINDPGADREDLLLYVKEELGDIVLLFRDEEGVAGWKWEK